MASNQTSMVVGVAMILAGVGLWGVATQAQAQRERTAAVAAASCPPVVAPSACAPCPACPTSVTPSTGDPSASAVPAASVAASASVAPSASVAASASAAPGASAEAEGMVFRFEPGKNVLPKDEMQRLIAYGRELQRQPRTKLLLEGGGDDATPEGALLGRRRAMITRQVLSEIGIDPERLVMPPATAAPGPSGGVRVRTLETRVP